VSDRRRLVKRVLVAALVAFLLWLPQYAEGFWLQTGLFAMSAAIGAIGLTLLVGVTGQLSLAHAFFLAVGAYGYCYLAGVDQNTGAIDQPAGLGLPPLLAMAGAVLLAGLAGALFSPIAGRLRGIYLGLASIGLVFIGQHILFNAKQLTGGFNGRDAAPMSLFGFSFSDHDPDHFVVFGVPYGQLERLWYLGLVLVAVAYWYARNVVRGRPGRAMEAIRDSEVAAATMGVNVPAYRAAAFTVSSMYAGLAGVFLALAFSRVVPESFGFLLSIDFLVMIVLGGLGSIGGAVLGALLVSALPQLLNHYSGSLPLVGEPGGEGLQPSDAARYLYGAAVVAVLILAPRGLAGLGRRILDRATSGASRIRSKESTA
jgi:branched-chain amino acid transport system permease protein